jgi:hypothetical protein
VRNELRYGATERRVAVGRPISVSMRMPGWSVRTRATLNKWQTALEPVARLAPLFTQL